MLFVGKKQKNKTLLEQQKFVSPPCRINFTQV